jgi:restriction system protein
MKKNMWMVRAGEGAVLFSDFKEKDVIAIGWSEAGDFTDVNDSSEIKDRIRFSYTDQKKGWISISAGQVSRFRFDFKIGDYVITYNPPERVYLIGEISSEYEYNPNIIEKFPNVRKVNWIEEIDRDKLTTSTKNTLGAISTIFDVGEDAKNEILDLLRGRETPDESSEETKDLLKEDMKQKAHEFIKDKVSKFDWDDMERLVAGILRAMGYKTRITPQGPDRGRDIEASPDGLGLVDPRIIVEVKHRSGQISRSDITSFIGGLRSGHKGIYVSTGGFSKDAKYEAERATIPITVLNLDDLINLIVQYYDSFDSETKALIPLTKIFWPE